MTTENTDTPLMADCPSAICSPSFEHWWNDQENGCPPLVLDNDEQFAHAVWNAAIKAADLAAWQNRDKWDEGDGYSPTKAAAAEEIGYSIRQLSVPNAPTQAPPTQNLTNQ